MILSNNEILGIIADHIVFDLCAITDETLNFARSIERAVLEKIKATESSPCENRAHDWWKVEVSLYDGVLITIESESLYGKSDLTSRDEETIRTAGRHLLSFVGSSQADHIVSANKMVAADHIPDAGNMARVDRDQIKEILQSFNEFRQRGHGMKPDDIIDKWLETEGNNLYQTQHQEIKMKNTSLPVVVYGAQGSGKTLSAKIYAEKYGKKKIHEEWDGISKLTRDTLAITNVKPPYKEDAIVISTNDKNKLRAWTIWAKTEEGHYLHEITKFRLIGTIEEARRDVGFLLKNMDDKQSCNHPLGNTQTEKNTAKIIKFWAQEEPIEDQISPPREPAEGLISLSDA